MCRLNKTHSRIDGQCLTARLPEAVVLCSSTCAMKQTGAEVGGDPHEKADWICSHQAMIQYFSSDLGGSLGWFVQKEIYLLSSFTPDSTLEDLNHAMAYWAETLPGQAKKRTHPHFADRWQMDLMALTLCILLDVFPPLVLLTVGKSDRASLALTCFCLHGRHLCS